MNYRDKRRPNSKTKTVDLLNNYVKPNQMKKTPNIIQLEKSKLLNNDENKETEDGEDGNKPNKNLIAIPECLRVLLKIEQEEVIEMNPRNIRNHKDKEVKCNFDYKFFNKEKYKDKEVDYLKSYLDNYNQHKYNEFKKMLQGKSCARPVGNIFISGEIDVDYEFRKMKKEKAKFVNNIKESTKKTRTFNETNDNISNYRNLMIIPSQNLGDTQNDKTPSQKNKNLKQPFRDIGKRKSDSAKQGLKLVENGKEKNICVNKIDTSGNVNVIIPQPVSFERIIIPIESNASSRNQSEAKSDSKSFKESKIFSESDKKINQNTIKKIDLINNNIIHPAETININQSHRNKTNNNESQLKLSQPGMSQLGNILENIQIVTQGSVNIPGKNSNENLTVIRSQSSSKNNDSISQFSVNDSISNAKSNSFMKNESNIFADSASSNKKNQRNFDNNMDDVNNSQKMTSKKDNSKVKIISISKENFSKKIEKNEIRLPGSKNGISETGVMTNNDNTKPMSIKSNILDNNLINFSKSKVNNDILSNINNRKDCVLNEFELLKNRKNLSNSNLVILESNKKDQDPIGNGRIESKSFVSSKKEEIIKNDSTYLIDIEKKEEKYSFIKPNNNSLDSKSLTNFKDNIILKKEENNKELDLNVTNSKQATNFNNKEFIKKDTQSKANFGESKSLKMSSTNLVNRQDNPFLMKMDSKPSEIEIQSTKNFTSNLNFPTFKTNPIKPKPNETSNDIQNLPLDNKTDKSQSHIENPINPLPYCPFIISDPQINKPIESPKGITANTMNNPSFPILDTNKKEIIQQNTNKNINMNLSNNISLNNSNLTNNNLLTNKPNPFVSKLPISENNNSFNPTNSVNNTSQLLQPPNEIAPIPVIESSLDQINANRIKNDSCLLPINQQSSSFNQNAPPSEMSLNYNNNSSTRFLQGNPFISNPSNVTNSINHHFNRPINSNDIIQNPLPNSTFQSNTQINLPMINNNLCKSAIVSNNIVTNSNSNSICPNVGSGSNTLLNTANPFLGSFPKNTFTNSNINNLQNNNQCEASALNVSMEIDQSNINNNSINNCNNINVIPYKDLQPSNNLIPNQGVINSFHNHMNGIGSNNNPIKPNPFTSFNNYNNNSNLPINQIQHNSIQALPQNQLANSNFVNPFTNNSSVNNTIQNPSINTTINIINTNNQLNSNPFVKTQIPNQNTAENNLVKFNSSNMNQNRFNSVVNNNHNPFLTNQGITANTNNNNAGSGNNIFLQAAFTNNNRSQQQSNQTSSLLQEREPEQRKYLKVLGNK